MLATNGLNVLLLTRNNNVNNNDNFSKHTIGSFFMTKRHVLVLDLPTVTSFVQQQHHTANSGDDDQRRRRRRMTLTSCRTDWSRLSCQNAESHISKSFMHGAQRTDAAHAAMTTTRDLNRHSPLSFSKILVLATRKLLKSVMLPLVFFYVTL